MKRREDNPWDRSRQKRYPTDEYDKQIPRFKQFLKKYSEGRSRAGARNKLITYLRWIQANTDKTHVLKVQLPDVERFFDEELNKRDIKIITKQKWRTKLNQYYKHIKEFAKHVNEKTFKEIMGIEKSEFVNPVPSTDMYYFDKESVTLEKIRNKKPILTYEDALKILNHFYYNHYNMFIASGFLAWSGARIQEVVSIRLISLDLQNRFFFNILKKTKQEDTYGVYFFPEFFVKHIKLYLDQMKLVFPDAIYLFPSRYLKDSHIVQQTVRNKIHDAADLLGIRNKVNPHAWRKRLNTERKRTGVMPEDRSILLNHNLNSTQAKHYLLQMEDFKEMKDLYDANFPYEEFEPNPSFLKDY